MTIEAERHAYFTNVRTEIKPLLRGNPERILEIGCGAGTTLAWLKSLYPHAETTGVDGYAGIEDDLRRNADHAIIHNLEHPLPDLGTFDLILALDVLEHLQRPEDVLGQLSTILRPSGGVIVSVPNIAHYKVIGGLLRRRFRYQDSGILDRTHLRFFTEESALALMNSAGLSVTSGVVNGPSRRKSRLISFLTLGAARHFLVEQYIMRGERSSEQNRVLWR